MFFFLPPQNQLPGIFQFFLRAFRTEKILFATSRLFIRSSFLGANKRMRRTLSIHSSHCWPRWVVYKLLPHILHVLILLFPTLNPSMLAPNPQVSVGARFVPCRSQWCGSWAIDGFCVWVVENEEGSFFYSVLVYGSLGSSACVFGLYMYVCPLLAFVASVTVRVCCYIVVFHQSSPSVCDDVHNTPV